MLERSTSKLPPKLGVRKFLGAWHFLSLPPLGGDIPHFTSAYYGPKYIDENSFYTEGIAFHLAEIWDFKFSKKGST